MIRIGERGAPVYVRRAEGKMEKVDTGAVGVFRGWAESGWGRCVLGLTLVLFSTWLTNVALYPGYASLFPEARDWGSTVNAATLAVLAIIGLKRPRSIDERKVTVVCASLLVVAYGIVVAALSSKSAPLLLTGALLRSAVLCWPSVMVGMALCGLGSRACMVGIAAAYCMSYALRALVAPLPWGLQVLLLLGSSLGALFVARPRAKVAFAALASAPAPETLSITQPLSFLPLAHRLFAAIVVFRAAFGFALAFGSVDGSPVQTFASVIPLLGLLALSFLPKGPKADVLYQVSALFVVAGFLVAMVVSSSEDVGGFGVANALLYSGSECFDALVWYVLASVGARNLASAFVVFAWGRAAVSAGVLVGALAGHAANHIAQGVLASAWIAAVLFLFMAVNLTALKSFGFQETIDGIRPMQSIAEEPVKPPAFEDRCAEVARAYRLTPRETEIMELLAHGRNGPFIQEKLVVSRNTVKTHVSNIYGKLGVHSQQELIDLVENGSPEGR